MIPVQSSAIRAIGFDGYALGVLFHGSNILYEHHRVPASLYVRFMRASSKGTFYNVNLRGKYPAPFDKADW